MIPSPLRKAFLPILLLGLAGCGAASSHVVMATPVKASPVMGRLKGGQQPVAGASLQLYAVGTTGDGSAATGLLVAPVVSGLDGGFDLTSDYRCPSVDTLVYLTAVGGNPGLATGVTNANLAMMAALGRCGDLNAGTFVEVNELTTVGALAALYPFATGHASVGSGSGDDSALTAAFAAAREYVSVPYGTVPGPALPSGYYASSVEIATLADILSTCVNSAGGVAGDGSACGNFFGDAQPSGGVAPTDTVEAVIDILNNPSHNVGELFNLGPGRGAPFEPTLSSAPTDWTLPILPIPATPTLSEPAGTYRGNQTISVSESLAGAVVYYTLDGSMPMVNSAVYAGPLTVTSPTTVSVWAVYDGRTSSAVASARYLVAPANDPPPISTVATQSSNGIPNSVVTWGRFEFVSVQGTGQIYTFDLSTGYQLLAVAPYRTACNSPSGMVVTTIAGQTVMAVVCYDAGSLLTLTVGADGSLSPLGSVGGLPTPFPGIVLVGTDVYVPLYGAVNSGNGGVARVSLATPSAPVVTATVALVSPQPGQFDNAGYMAERNGYLYVTAGSESQPDSTSSTIQVVQESTMTVVGTPLVVPHSPQQLAVSGTTLFATIYDAEQVIAIDVSNPASLAEVGALLTGGTQTPCSAESIAVSGSMLYVGCYGNNQILQVDASNAAAMTITGSAAVVSPQRIVTYGASLLVTDGTANGGVTLVNTATAF